MSFCVGDRVKIVNLKKKTDLNGLRGIIIQEGELKGDRFGVQIVKTKKKYKLKPENLAFDTTDEEGMRKHVICPMCKQKFVAESQKQCEEHMSTCPAFLSAYGSGPASLETQSNAVLHGLNKQ